MKHTLICGLLLCLWSHVGFGSQTSHNVQRRETNPNSTLELEIQMSVSPSWNITVGDTVVINCTTQQQQQQQQENDDKVTLQLVWTKLGPEEKTKKKVLGSGPASTGFSYILGPVTHEHSGVYTCTDDGSVSHVDTDAQHSLVWVNDVSPVTLDLPRINNLKFFREHSVSLICHMPDAHTQWRIMRFNQLTGNITECPNQETKDLDLSCPATHVDTPYLLFWCESAEGIRSNVVNISSTVSEHLRNSEVIGTKMTVSPSWFLSVGDNATIECTQHKKTNMSDKVDLLLTHTKMDPDDPTMKVLQRRRASEGLSFSLGPVTHEDRGVYTCLDDGTWPYVMVHPWNHFIWVEDESPSVTIDVLSHNRTQFFHGEVVTVGCQLPDDNSEWKLIWADKWFGKIYECTRSTLSSSRHLTCTVTLGYPWSDKLFWCESVTTGERSNVLNTTGTVGNKVLESPPLPVLEGEDVTLRCLYKDKTTNKIITNVSTHLYKNDRHFRYQKSDATFILKSVTKADEGFYACSMRLSSGMGLKSWLSVKARPKPDV